MTFTHSNKDYQDSYTRKKESSEKRGIEITITKEEYIALLKSRPTLVCGYTNQPFVMNKGSQDKMYPEMDRIDPNKGYIRGNIIFCARKVHKLKTDYIENEKSRKGIGHGNICMLRSIEKVLSMKSSLDKRLQPYEDIFNKVQERKQEVEQKAIKAEQKVIKQTEEEKQDKIAQKFKKQQEFAKYYFEMSKEFEGVGQIMQITTREMRDILRITKDSVTGKPFKTIWDRYLWVVDKSKPITKDNIKVMYHSTAMALDKISEGDNMILKTAIKNLNKIL